MATAFYSYICFLIKEKENTGKNAIIDKHKHKCKNNTVRIMTKAFDD